MEVGMVVEWYPFRMTNNEVAEVFERIALILDLKGGENPFRIRAYSRAAAILSNLPHELRDIYEQGGLGALEKLPGIGKDLGLKIEELLKTQKLKALTTLEKGIPKGLLEIMEIEGMGPKKTKFIWMKFKVKSIPELKKLAASGKLSGLKGWGEKSVGNILKGIELQKKMAGRLPIGDAWPLGEEIRDALMSSKLCAKVEVAGSLRRQKETIGDIDILATCSKPKEAMEFFCGLPQVERVLAKGSTKSSVFLKAGVDADLRVVDASVFGAALHYFTGSKAHNVRIRKMGIRKGITISEYGVYRGTAKRKGKLLAARTEKDVYKAVGMAYIEPELREDRGEIEAALKGKLPRLIEEGDLKGDLHLHSFFSDGADSMVEMARAAKEAGLSYIAITDHASPMGMVKGIKEKNIKGYLQKIEEARKKVKGIHILAGTEVDILEDGKLYLPDEVLKELDFVVASMHQNFKQSRAKATARLLTVLQNPFVDLIGHPTTRMLGRREGMDIDMEEVLKEAKKKGVALELNASPARLDLPDIYLKRAKEMGVKIFINSDAHSVNGINHHYGITHARRGWLEKKDVINTKSWKEFETWLKGRRG